MVPDALPSTPPFRCDVGTSIEGLPTPTRASYAAAMPRFLIATGALLGLLAVALSAWVAHGLAADPSRLRMADAAVAQQAWHALALLATGILLERWGGRLLAAAGACFLLGVLAFCGGVWLAVLRLPSPGPVAPIGGLLLMLGWALLLAAAVRGAGSRT